MDIQTRKIGRYTYVRANDELVAIMERSPFTGDWCYGLRADHGQRAPLPVPTSGPAFSPPFTSTRKRTAKAAAKIAVAASLA